MALSVGLGLFVVSLAAALAALAIAAALPRPQAAPPLFADPGTEAVFLFDDEVLVDATASARALLSAVRGAGGAWQRLLAFAESHFPGAGRALADLPESGAVVLPAASGEPLLLRAEWRGGLRRIALIDTNREAGLALRDPLVQRAQDDELAQLRAVADHAPFPIWREGADGAPSWTNEHYAALVQDGGRAAWPPPALFATARDGTRARPLPGRSFDLRMVPDGAGQIGYALPADGAVRAETALRDFVQTLSLAFAHLPIGLAVFDRERRLQLFNPALTDLLTLPVGLLSARPTLGALLDALRDRRMIPEPKDYKVWRRHLVEAGADGAALEETWTLPGDRTWRVTARPHPAGALAILIEDITDTIGRLRDVRSDIALMRATLDAMDEAVALIARDGTVTLCNAAFRAALGDFAGQPAAAIVAACAARGAGGAAFDAIAADLARFGAERAAAEAQLRFADGRPMRLRLVPVTQGSALLALAPDATGAWLRTAAG